MRGLEEFPSRAVTTAMDGSEEYGVEGWAAGRPQLVGECVLETHRCVAIAAEWWCSAQAEWVGGEVGWWEGRLWRRPSALGDKIVALVSGLCSASDPLHVNWGNLGQLC